VFNETAMSSEQFRLTTSSVVNRLRERHGIVRTPDTVRLWARTGRLRVLELENGQRLYSERDVDELGARMAANPEDGDGRAILREKDPAAKSEC
jgi:hypothetical protein